MRVLFICRSRDSWLRLDQIVGRSLERSGLIARDNAERNAGGIFNAR
jgi:hypothetical protein